MRAATHARMAELGITLDFDALAYLMYQAGREPFDAWCRGDLDGALEVSSYDSPFGNSWPDSAELPLHVDVVHREPGWAVPHRGNYADPRATEPEHYIAADLRARVKKSGFELEDCVLPPQGVLL